MVNRWKEGEVLILRSGARGNKVTTIDGEAIGARVRAEREARGWSMRWLGHKAGVSYAYISQLEAGKYPKPGYEQLSKLAGAMSLTLAQLMGVSESEATEINADAVLTYLRLLTADDPAGLVRDLAALPADVQHNLAALIRSLAASYSGRGGAAGQGASVVEAGGDNGR